MADQHRRELRPLLCRDHLIKARPVPVRNVVAGQWHGVLAFGELDLEDHMATVAKSELGSGEVELPHATKAFVIQRCNFVAVSGKALTP